MNNNAEEKYGTVAMLKVAIASLHKLLASKSIVTKSELSESFDNMLKIAESSQNEPSSKDQDANLVTVGDSEFDSLAAFRVLCDLVNTMEKYGHGSSMMHPRLSISLSVARNFIKSSTNS